MSRHLAILAVFAFVVAIGCNEASLPVPADVPTEARANKVEAPSPASKEDKAVGWGTIKGQIVFDGDQIPERKKIDVNQDAAHCLGAGPLLSEDAIVNKQNKGIQWAFVWLEADSGGAPLAVHPNLKQIKIKEVFMDQPQCQFVPHALGIREGQDLVVKNSAPVAHNVHYVGHPTKNPGDNKIVPAGKSLTVSELRADKFPVKVECNIHRWMGAWVRIYDHPYFAVTDADGKFEIKDAPAGKFRLKGWHELKGWLPDRSGLLIEIKADGVTDVGAIKTKLE